VFKPGRYTYPIEKFETESNRFATMFMKGGGRKMKAYRFSVVIERDKGGYSTFCPKLQGCYVQGDTHGEALENIKDAIRLHVKVSKRG
jgi:predicted RNase H-like HicB family nuclease